MKILILEDDVHLLKVLSWAMSPYGEYYATDNGADAVRVFDEAMTAGEPFQLALLDIMMPGMNGFEALQHIRRIETLHKRDGRDGAKIIMLTALDSATSILQSFRENCEAYLTKPYTPEDLEAVLRGLGIKKRDKTTGD